MFVGLNPEKARALAHAFAAASAQASGAADNVARAIRLAQLPSQLAGDLDDRSDRYRLAEHTLHTAIDTALGYELDPGLWTGVSLAERLGHLEALLAADLGIDDGPGGMEGSWGRGVGSEVEAGTLLFARLAASFAPLAATVGNPDHLTRGDLEAAVGVRGDADDARLTDEQRAIALLLLADGVLWSRLTSASRGWGGLHSRVAAGTFATRADVEALLHRRDDVRAVADAWPQLAGEADEVEAARLARIASGTGAVAEAARAGQRLAWLGVLDRASVQTLAFDLYAYVGEPDHAIAFATTLPPQRQATVSGMAQGAFLATVEGARIDDATFEDLLARIPDTTPHAAYDDGWKDTLSLAADLTPGVSGAKAIAGVVVGRDLVTGRSLSRGERAWAGAGLFAPGAIGRGLRAVRAPAKAVATWGQLGGHIVRAAAPTLTLGRDTVEVWEREPAARTSAAKRALATTLYRDFDALPRDRGAVDFWDAERKEAVKVIAVDLNAASLQGGGKLETALRRATGQLASAAVPASHGHVRRRVDVVVPPGSVRDRHAYVLASVRATAALDRVQIRFVGIGA